MLGGRRDAERGVVRNRPLDEIDLLGRRLWRHDEGNEGHASRFLHKPFGNLRARLPHDGAARRIRGPLVHPRASQRLGVGNEHVP